MYAQQLQAYRTVEKSTLLDGRDLEASILTKAAHMLTRCKNNWAASENSELLDEALKYNQKMWSFFQSELANPENPLPRKIREDILSLSLFIDKRIMEFLLEPAPEKLNVIININLNLAAGLRSTGR